MKTRFMPLLLTALLLGFAASACAQQTFTLRGVRSNQDYGPFAFRHGSLLKLESGVFKLNILADGRAFTLLDTETGLAYGVYELVLGRMIDIGEVLFTITRVSAPPTPSVTVQAPSPSVLDNTEFGIALTLLHQTAYDWEINGENGGDHNIDRGSVALKARKGLVNLQIGLTTDAEWDHTIAGDGERFENAEMTDGTGWFAAVGLRIPVFTEGHWSGIVHGEAFYRREELSLQYGAWELESITTVTQTNALTNAVIVTENRRYNNNDDTATLTETLVSVGLELAYTAPILSVYAGLRALPWSDTALDAVITSDDKRYKITFERKDPVMAYGGIGLTLMEIKAYLEVEGGGETALRLGLARAF
jgi:hypothetical protein